VASGTQFDPHLVSVLTRVMTDFALCGNRLATSTTHAGMDSLPLVDND
jgi:hypothetical protein